MGSWTGKYDPLRKLHERSTKRLGFDPSIFRNVHTKIADKAHETADTYLNQEPEGPGAKKRKDDQRVADYSQALSSARGKTEATRRLSIMRRI